MSIGRLKLTDRLSIGGLQLAQLRFLGAEFFLQAAFLLCRSLGRLTLLGSRSVRLRLDCLSWEMQKGWYSPWAS